MASNKHHLNYNMTPANRVALNTAILYARMLLTMGISLYATRVVLKALGSTDFGIFNLIAGIILMLSFLNTTMATSTQRYLSYYQGKEDLAMQKKVFQNSLWLHIAIGFFICLLLEAVGFFLFDGFLNIPTERIGAARTIYHFMAATVFFGVVAVPFNGTLVAHENMLWVAIVSVLETVLKLAIALALLVFSGDKLVLYGCLTAAISVVGFLLYATYCYSKYPECDKPTLSAVNRETMKELGGFAGWNLFGTLCFLGRTQGLAVLLNIFLGTVVNAAYGLANQVSSQLNFFSATLLRALNPQIMKSEGGNDRERMLRLSMMASKFGFFLLAIFAVPFIFEMEAILKLWLDEVPPYTVVFCQYILIATLANQLTIGLQSAVQAIGNIKVYQIVVGGILLLNLPIAYLLLKLDQPAHYILISYVLVELIACLARLLSLRKIGGLSIRLYTQRVFMKEVIPLLLAIATAYFCTVWWQTPWRFLITSALSGLVFAISVFIFGLCKEEKVLILDAVGKMKNRLKTQDIRHKTQESQS